MINAKFNMISDEDRVTLYRGVPLARYTKEHLIKIIAILGGR